MSGPLRWEREGRDWPHRDASRFVDAGGLTWHVQQTGAGPDVLLIHGTGAATHSWRAVMPALAERFAVTAIDLPGHAFTRGKLAGGSSLPGIVKALGALMTTLEIVPRLLVGHSAGAAIALNYARRHGSETPVVALSPALMPFRGLAANLFPALAKLLFVNPFAPRIFAQMARGRGEVARFLDRATASRIDAKGLTCYATLFGNAQHCAGTLAMMADWDLESFSATLPTISCPVLLAHGERDPAVPLRTVEQAAKLLPNAELVVWPGLGHLAHEEAPDQAVAAITRFAADHGIGR